MPPVVIDLTSSPEPEDESPGKAARSALKQFQPRPQKAKPGRTEVDDGEFDESPTKAARTTLEGFQPRKQKRKPNVNIGNGLAGLPDDARAELQRVRPFSSTPTSRQTGSKNFNVVENGYERPVYSAPKPYETYAHGHPRATNFVESSHDDNNGFPDEYIRTAMQPHRPRAISTEQNGVENRPLANQNSRQPLPSKVSKAFKAPVEIVDLEEEGSKESTRQRSARIPEAIFGGVRPFKRRRIDDLDASFIDDAHIPTLESLISGDAKETRPSRSFGGIDQTTSNHASPVENVSTKPSSIVTMERRPSSGQDTISKTAAPPSAAFQTRQLSTQGLSNWMEANRRITNWEAASHRNSLERSAESPALNSKSQNLVRNSPPAQKSQRSEERQFSKQESEHHQSSESMQSRSLDRERTTPNTAAVKPIGTPSNHGVPYSPEEDALLKRLREVDLLNWDEIKLHFNGRTLGSLQVRYGTKLKGRSRTQDYRPGAIPNGTTSNYGVPYASEEDALLVKLKEVDMLSWEEMVPYFQGRTPGSLQVRYGTCLRKKSQKQKPDVIGNGVSSNHGVPYSPDEDALLKKLKEVDMLSWDEMLPFFQGRTHGSLQVRYSSKLKGRSNEANLNQDRSFLARLQSRSASPEDILPARRQRRKRNNEVSVTAGFISWADVKKKRLIDENETFTEDERLEEETDQQYVGERAHPRSMSRILRQREIGSSTSRSCAPSIRSVPAELKEHVFDNIGPQKYFKGTSGDVTCLAWAPDGSRFAAGSIAITDERSMQYNRPCNLLLGDHPRSLLSELPEHHIPRPHVDADSGNVNGLHSMRESQDRRLFMTVAGVQFSSDSRTLYSAGTDHKVRAYSFHQGVERASCENEIKHPAPVYLLSASNQDVLATACHQSADGSIGVHRSGMPSVFLSPSRHDTQTERAIYPSALKWGISARHSNLLLAGFSIDSIDDERDMAGETCLWDIRAEARIPIYGVTRNVFDVTWNPSPSSTSTVFAVASTPGPNKVNKGMRTVVQCFAPNQNRAVRVIDLECPAFDINDVIYCPHDDNLIAAGATDGKVYVWDQRFANKDQAPLHILSHDDSLNVLDHDRDREIADTGVRFLSWGATSSRLYSGSSDGVVKVWNPHRSSNEALVKDVATFTSAVMSGAFSPDYRDLLIGEDQGRINSLSVGHGDKSLRSMERFELHSAPAPYKESQSTMSEGHEAARELINSREIEFRPMGALPIRQAVQGPAYKGPYLAPSATEVRYAEAAYQQGLDEQNDAHSHAEMNASQSEPSQSLREADKKVEAAQERLLALQSRLDDSAELQPKAKATQQALRRAERDRMKLEASLSRALENCRLDCNYLPANIDGDAKVLDSHRSETRIPTALWRVPDIDASTMTAEDLVEAGLTRKCMTCLGPAPKPRSGLPLCLKCDRIKRGLTSSCEICSAPTRPPTDRTGLNLCERCNFACLRCGRPCFIARNANRITCDSCGLAWTAGVLGYELEKRAIVSKGTSKVGRARETKHDDTVAVEEHFGDVEIEHYASRWQSI